MTSLHKFILKIILRATLEYTAAEWRCHAAVPNSIPYHKVYKVIITINASLCEC